MPTGVNKPNSRQMPTPIVSTVAPRLTQLSRACSGLVSALSIAAAVADIGSLFGRRGSRGGRRGSSCSSSSTWATQGFGRGRCLGRFLGDSFFLERDARRLRASPATRRVARVRVDTRRSPTIRPRDNPSVLAGVVRTPLSRAAIWSAVRPGTAMALSSDRLPIGDDRGRPKFWYGACSQRRPWLLRQSAADSDAARRAAFASRGRWAPASGRSRRAVPWPGREIARRKT